MLKKIYDNTKNYIINNYKFLLTWIIIFILFTVELPFYIEKPGGIINVDDRIKIDSNYEISGSFNLSYVSELSATVPTLLYSLLNKDWDIIKKEDITYDNETVKEANVRSKLMLENSKITAIAVAYTKADKTIKINKEKIYIASIDENSDTDLKIGDQILEMDNIVINYKEQLNDILSKKNKDEQIKFKVQRDDKEIYCYGTVQEIDDKKIIGIGIIQINDIETDPLIELEFKDSESGPSGGLMLTLSIYNHLISEDITKGRKIVGTGTIDEDGNVGEIGGIEYKIKGAVKEKADIFLVPYGENYEDAKKIVEENNYELELIPVSTFDEALEKLK